jgi:16S rRNA (guanine966-N2)-methyltransferase
LAPWLAPGALIYVEGPRNLMPSLPRDWALHREDQTRDVRYALHRAAD